MTTVIFALIDAVRPFSGFPTVKVTFFNVFLVFFLITGDLAITKPLHAEKGTQKEKQIDILPWIRKLNHKSTVKLLIFFDFITIFYFSGIIAFENYTTYTWLLCYRREPRKISLHL